MYDINTKNITKTIPHCMLFIFVGVFFLIILLGGLLTKNLDKSWIIFLIIPIGVIIMPYLDFKKIISRLKVVKKLNKTGKLIKGLKYNLESANIMINDVKILRMVVEFTTKSGEVVKLYGDPIMDGTKKDNDRLVDLVIDEDNANNYFIDFEINRLTGNLPADYYNYQPNMENITNDKTNINPFN